MTFIFSAAGCHGLSSTAGVVAKSWRADGSVTPEIVSTHRLFLLAPQRAFTGY